MSQHSPVQLALPAPLPTTAPDEPATTPDVLQSKPPKSEHDSSIPNAAEVKVTSTNQNGTALPSESASQHQKVQVLNEASVSHIESRQHETTANAPGKLSASEQPVPAGPAPAVGTSEPADQDGLSQAQPCSICLGVMQSFDGQLGLAASNTLLKKFSKDDNSAGVWTPLPRCTLDAVADAFR